MDASENRRAVIVGIFIALGILIFIVGVLTMGNAQKSFTKNITVSAVFDDVGGLKKGNNVWFSGVKIGTISDIRFVGLSQVKVKMNIDEATQQYIHRNAGVHLSSDGLIGNKIIVIDGGSPQAPAIQNGDVLQAEKLTSTDDMMKTLQANNVNLLAITNDFKVLTHKIVEGKGVVGALMADSTMAMQLRATMHNLQVTTERAAQMTQQLNTFAAKVNTPGGLANKMLTDTATFKHIQAAVTTLQQAAESTASMTEQLNVLSQKLNNKDNVINVLVDDKRSAAQVKSAIDNLQVSSVKLNETLEAAQHNFLLKGFFKKKAKAEADSLKKAGQK